MLLIKVITMLAEYDGLFCEYNDFVRRKNVMMEMIGDALEGVTERLVHNSEEMTDSKHQELEQVQERLEATYEDLESVVP